MAAGVDIAERPESVRVSNARTVDMPFYLEPWGEEYTLAPGAVIEVLAEGPPGASLEVELADDHITVYGWPGSVVTLYQDGAELGAGGGKRMRVPALPLREEP
ncbi:MAG TPA: hypothetical protein VFE42_36495 [Chloroflexota bacterium]|nr:hypothetical protein [Chloroflexota bacterium]